MGAKRILTVHSCLVCVIVVKNAMHVPNLRFLVIFMLCACPFVIFNGLDLAINQHYGANVNSIHASCIVYSPNEQSLFTILTELQYLTNYNT